MTAGNNSNLSASALLRKLDALSPLTQDGAEALQRAAQSQIRHCRSREDLISEGDKPQTLRMILSGWACRYKMLEDGRRQILNLLLPGDTCDFNMFHVSRMDHSVGALTPVVYADVTRDVFEQLTTDHPSVAQALICETLSDASIQREWTMNLGQRDAYERIAHLFCEVFVRSQVVGLAGAKDCRSRSPRRSWVTRQGYQEFM
ncbi:Crp/Fnr family transcriptional regulator [Micromonospora sp. STR1s_5]|nr:Crp/Fnr family transcriptional regulator [Micromonospora sp. STR1s_5]